MAAIGTTGTHDADPGRDPAAGIDADRVEWNENGQLREARWCPLNQGAAPRRVTVIDDSVSADTAYRLATQGTTLLWRGDFHNARQLLQALARRIDARKPKRSTAASDPRAAFDRHRLAQSQRAQLLGRLVLEVDAQGTVLARRAPDVQAAWAHALGAATRPTLVSLRALQGILGAYEWYKNGVAIPGLPARIHVGYGVFSPIRGEYLDLVARAPLPSHELAFDIGTGSGVISAILAHRGVRRIVATDVAPRALACARENLARMQLDAVVDVRESDLFPPGRSPLIVCNPPWLPAKPTSSIEQAVYDPGSRMLLGFLDGLDAHLTDDGEAWLILSDFAEQLGLRPRDFLENAFRAAGMEAVGRLDAKPQHPKTRDPSDALHHARQAETTTLWRLRRRARSAP